MHHLCLLACTGRANTSFSCIRALCNLLRHFVACLCIYVLLITASKTFMHPVLPSNISDLFTFACSLDLRLDEVFGDDVRMRAGAELGILSRYPQAMSIYNDPYPSTSVQLQLPCSETHRILLLSSANRRSKLHAKVKRSPLTLLGKAAFMHMFDVVIRTCIHRQTTKRLNRLCRSPRCKAGACRGATRNTCAPQLRRPFYLSFNTQDIASKLHVRTSFLPLMTAWRFCR